MLSAAGIRKGVNEMKKRAISMLLALVISLGLLPLAATANPNVLTGECGNEVTWSYNPETKVLTIEGTGKMKDLDAIDDADGTDLFGRHSAEVYQTEHIVIREGVTHIGDRAFSYCGNVKSVEIPSSVKSIGYDAFCAICPWYQKIVSGNADVIINDILLYTPKTGDIVIKKPISSIAGGAIKNATSIYLEESVSFISDGAIDCPNLESITVMNPNCIFSYTIAPTTICGFYGVSAWGDETYDILPGLTVYGHANSTAQKYCEMVNSFGVWKDDLTENPWNFVALNPFTDVPAGCWYEAPVLWALENGVTSGTSDTTFAPGNQCLRAHVVTFLWKAEQSPEPTAYTKSFTDVPSGAWYYKPVHWAVENGITSGVSDTKFGAGDVCSRYQVVYFLWAAAGKPEPETTENPFTDVKPSHFFYKAVLWAVENGITSGTSETTFSPANPCNRAQVVTFLYSAYGK